MQSEYYNINYLSHEEYDTTEIIQPISTRSRPNSKEVFGYHPYWVGTAWTNYNFELISTLAFFSAEINATGSIDNLHGWPIPSLINQAHAHGTKVVLVATLFDSNDLVTLLSNHSYKQNLINNLIAQVQLGNADGVNIDFESLPVSQRDNMIDFIQNLTSAFHSTIPGSEVTIATPAVDWNNAWDYNALATISDGLFIMGYSYHWGGSTISGPVAPLAGTGYTLTWTLNDYLNKTNYQIDKLILGCPYYGFEWPTSSSFPGANTTGTGVAKFYSEIEGLALSYGKRWHESSQTPWYAYENNSWNQGWYDDSLSLSLKYDFALLNELKGIGIWALGYDGNRSELWNLLNSKFGEESLLKTSKLIELDSLTIYPNPANNSFTVNYSTLNNNHASQISINNILGEEIYSTLLPTNKTHLTWTWYGFNNHGNPVPNGIYFISIQNGNQIQTKKVTLLK